MTAAGSNIGGQNAGMQLTPEQTKLFASAMQNQQAGSVNNLPPEKMKELALAMQKQKLMAMPFHKRKFTQFMQYIVPKFQAGVHHLDRFINFIVHPKDEDRNDVIQSARNPILFGVTVIIIFFVFGGFWAAFAPLDSASAAIGTVVSNTNRKTIQHATGGIIKEIYIEQGDVVKAGEPLIVFDDTKLKAEYEASLATYRALKASESRLIAQKDNLPNIEFAPELLKDAERPEVIQIMETQRRLFQSEREYFKNIEDAWRNSTEQYKNTLISLREAKISAKKTHDVMLEKLRAAKALFEKGNISKHAMLDIESKYTDTKAQLLAKDIEILKTEQEISKLNANHLTTKNELLTQHISRLRETQQNLGEIKERYAATKDALERAIVTSPVDGTVISIPYSTVGGVVSPGSAIAEISPANDMLVIQGQIAPRHIAYLTPGMVAKIRFSAFKSRTTPTFTGKVISISPDLIIDNRSQTGEGGYYVAKIEIDMEEFNKEAERLNLVLLPGMQAEINIITGTRTLLRYLLDPITDNMFKAFKEK